MSGIAAPITTFQTGCHSSAGRIERDRGVGDEDVVEHDGVGAGGAKAERVPRPLDAGRPRRRTARRSAGPADPSGASSQRMLVTRRWPASHPLAGDLRALTRYPPSTRRALPLEADPVGGSRADQHGPVVDDLAKERGDVHPVAVPPDLGGDEGGSASRARRPSRGRAVRARAGAGRPRRETRRRRRTRAARGRSSLPSLRRLSNASSEISPLRSRSAAEGPSAIADFTGNPTQSVPVSVAAGLAVVVMIGRMGSAASGKQFKNRTHPVQNLDRRAPPHEVTK